MNPTDERPWLTIAWQAKSASRELAILPRARKDAWLLAVADDLTAQTAGILAANQEDMDSPAARELSPAMRDRLLLNEKRIAQAAEGLRQVASLHDPVGEVLEARTRPNGLEIRKVRVPLGVIFFLYESRPNVTLDAAGLCVKSGNAVILRGGKEALHSNLFFTRLLQRHAVANGLPKEAIQLVESTDRNWVDEFLQLPEWIDLVIPRGGESLIRRVTANSKIPVLKHYLGNCHVYVHSAADFAMAKTIVINAKCSRPSVCNAMETLLVDREIYQAFLGDVGPDLISRGVELRGCPLTRGVLPQAGEATEQDFATEFADLILAVRVVDGLEDAIRHIHRFGSGHTEAIVTKDTTAASHFQQMVDASAVMVNASTRFNDGFELGLGAEIGISTDKLHARGPCGLTELTTYKYLVSGVGQIRE